MQGGEEIIIDGEKSKSSVEITAMVAWEMLLVKHKPSTRNGGENCMPGYSLVFVRVSKQRAYHFPLVVITEK